MKQDEIREKLLQHLGEDRYRDFLRDFVRVARQKGRLTFWLERALANAGIRLTYEECLPIFTFCHTHKAPLARRHVPIRRDVSDVRYSKEFEKATALRFPYAQQYVIFNDSLGSAQTFEVEQCDQCLEELHRFLAKSAPEIQGLVLSVEDVFQVPERGTVVTGTRGSAWESVKIGDAIDLRKPDGSTTRTAIRELEVMRKGVFSGPFPGAVLLADQFASAHVPLNTRLMKVLS
jgi:hypothetical protein